MKKLSAIEAERDRVAQELKDMNDAGDGNEFDSGYLDALEWVLT